MHRSTRTTMALFGSALAAVAVLVASPAHAVNLVPDADDTGAATGTAVVPNDRAGMLGPGGIELSGRGATPVSDERGRKTPLTTGAPLVVIPYLSHGQGVDPAIFGGTGVEPVLPNDRAGRLGPGAIAPASPAPVASASPTSGSDGGFEWTWLGFGTFAAIGAALAAYALTRRSRDRVAFP